LPTSSRQKRLEKLRTHREKAVDDSLLALARSRTAEDSAQKHLAAEVAELVRAQAERASAIGKTFDVNTLAEAHDWMLSCARRRDVAEQQLHRAQAQVVKAQTVVVAAKNDLKKIELVFERLRTKERALNDRIEQRQNDELSAARIQLNRRRSEP
jgi:flagellar export protein FliJ